MPEVKSEGFEKLSVNEDGSSAAAASADDGASKLTPEERAARQEAKKKKKAEEKAAKEAKKAAAAAQRGQKAAVITKADPDDPHGEHYGDYELVQSKNRSQKEWTEVGQLDESLVGKMVRSPRLLTCVANSQLSITGSCHAVELQHACANMQGTLQLRVGNYAGCVALHRLATACQQA